MDLFLTTLGIVNALGNSRKEVLNNALAGDQSNFIELPLPPPPYDKKCAFAAIGAQLPEAGNCAYDMRCSGIILHCLSQIIDDIDRIKSAHMSHRIGVVIGSCNSGIHEMTNIIHDHLKRGDDSAITNLNLRLLEQGSPSSFLSQYLEIDGPSYTVSTACSSSAKAFASARNLMENDICDAVIVGGADSICSIAINGFHALEALSYEKSNPFSRNRSGINLGEGGAIFIMEKDVERGARLMGIGESSDAYHITSPDPSGAGAEASMRYAMDDAGLHSGDISYINLHGTGTFHNDAMERLAVSNVFDNPVLCGSTKQLTGHTLGAAGATEIALCWLMMSDLNDGNGVIPHIYDGEKIENSDKLVFPSVGYKKELAYCMSNSFAFGGSNASIVIGRPHA